MGGGGARLGAGDDAAAGEVGGGAVVALEEEGPLLGHGLDEPGRRAVRSHVPAHGKHASTTLRPHTRQGSPRKRPAGRGERRPGAPDDDAAVAAAVAVDLPVAVVGLDGGPELGVDDALAPHAKEQARLGDGAFHVLAADAVVDGEDDGEIFPGFFELIFPLRGRLVRTASWLRRASKSAGGWNCWNAAPMEATYRRA